MKRERNACDHIIPCVSQVLVMLSYFFPGECPSNQEPSHLNKHRNKAQGYIHNSSAINLLLKSHNVTLLMDKRVIL